MDEDGAIAADRRRDYGRRMNGGTQRADNPAQDDTIDGARAAATLILMRDCPEQGNPATLLMIERAQTMAFAPGALVFPGGAVDEADRVLARSTAHGLDFGDAAARIAAIREMIEEAGILVGVAGGLTPDRLAHVRARLHGGASLGEMLAEHGLSLALDALQPFARWCPLPLQERRRFDTRFYVARAGAEHHDGVEDSTESVRLRWATAEAFLADVRAGREQAIFPTVRNLERLALSKTHAEVIAAARSIPMKTVVPWVEERDGRRHRCIPADLGYPVTSQAIDE